ncbi:hypothetical protein [Pseudomonas brassicacearum]|uniref:hypothetical protein n=1 Tax=Pseudomonas TaxID=286 RepID=UPI001BDE67EA|nr:hypothetical protein [Pseudomonas brassicacearum]
MSIAEKIEIEKLVSSRLLSARGLMSQRKAEAIRGVPLPTTASFPPEALKLPIEFVSAPISTAIYKLIAAEFRDLPKSLVTAPMISEARVYTSELLGVDLDAVRVEIVPLHEWDEGDSIEGFQVPVGIRDHLVFVPDRFSSPEELLCHELGHAAHVTAQRMNGELPYFDNLPTTAEFVAHYVQFNYLLNHKDRIHFVAALGQLTTASYALSIFASGIYDNFVSYLGSDWAKEIRKAMPIGTVERTYAHFQANPQEMQNQAMRGIAIVLALLLIDEHEGMKRFVSIDRIDHSLEAKLRTAFPDVDFLGSFAKVNEQILQLLERFDLDENRHDEEAL